MRTVRELGEFGLIDRISRLLPSSPNVIEGIGDDCAILRVHDHLLLVSVDLFIEDIHFRRNLEPEQIGWRAAASSLSDIAAMGGVPYFSLISLACPLDTPVGYIEALYRGMTSALSRHNTVIVGGDTTRSPQGLAIDVMVIGEAPAGRYLLRSNAVAGDLLAVTGPLGLSAAGLHALEHGIEAPALIRAHAEPHPRISEGQWLCANRWVHAMIDVSDGLLQDAGHIARTSGLGLDVHRAQIPVDDSLRAYAESAQIDPLEFALFGGEDYELAFALDPEDVPRFIDEFENQFNSKVAILGEFTGDWEGARIDGQPVSRTGFDHFKAQLP